MGMAEPVVFELRGEFITLAALLKASGAASSGGDAKALATGGSVQVNGQPEARRGRKLRAGDEVRAAGAHIRIQAAP